MFSLISPHSRKTIRASSTSPQARRNCHQDACDHKHCTRSIVRLSQLDTETNRTRRTRLCPPPPPHTHTHTLCQGPAQLGATRGWCDAWGTLRSTVTPLFERKLKAFVENNYSPFFVHVFQRSLSQFWNKKLQILSALLSRSHKMIEGHMK